MNRRERLLEVGLAIVLVGLPLAFLPASASPFVDLKLVLLLVGTLLVVLGTEGVDRLVAGLALLWTGILFLASAFGIDPIVSLAGPDNLGTGLLLLGPCAVLLVCGTGVPEGLARRLPLWIMMTALPIALLTIVYRLVPDTLFALVPTISFEGATLGHPVVVSGICAAGVAAAVGVQVKRPTLFVLAMLILGSGLAVSTKRVGLLAVAVALLVALWKTRPPGKRVAMVVVPILAALVLWTGLGAVAGPEANLSGAERIFSAEPDYSVRSRLLAWQALSRAVAERPALGWGPGMTLDAHVTTATTDELAERYADAHNLFIESAVTSGLLGLAALLALTLVLLRRAWLAPRDYGWASGVAAGLLVYHLVQPMGLALTPMLALIAGVAAGPPCAAIRERSGAGRRVGHWAVAAGLAVGVVLAGLVLVSGLLQRYGSTYNDLNALRAAHTLAPWRIAGAESYGTYLSLDARAGSEEARRQASELAEQLIADHPNNSRVRLIAADIYGLMREEERARELVAEHVARFPADRAATDVATAPEATAPAG